MSLLKLATGMRLGAVVRLPRHLKGDVAERLASHLTVWMLLGAALFCVTHFFWGRGQINCWLEHQDTNDHWVSFINDYCYVQGTYFVPLTEAEPWRSPDRVSVDYYQWVPYVLALMALVMHAPHVVWTRLLCAHVCGVDLMDMCHMLHVISLKTCSEGVTPIYRTKCVAYIRQVVDSLHHRHPRHGWLVPCALLSKVVYLATSVGLFVAIDGFIGGTSFWWAPRLSERLLHGDDWRQTGLFPRIAYCEHMRHHRFGSPPQGMIKCTLPMMAYYEKIFMMLWYWLALVCTVNTLSLIHLIYECLAPRSNQQFIRRHCLPHILHCSDSSDNLCDSRVVDAETLAYLADTYLRADGCLLLRRLGLSTLNLSHVITELYVNIERAYCCDEKNAGSLIIGRREPTLNHLHSAVVV